MTMSLLEQFKDSPISKLNLTFCGRVSNEWITVIRNMKLEQLNLSHCLISNDGINQLKKTKRDERKKGGSSPVPLSNSPTLSSSPHVPLTQYPITNTLVNLNLSYNGTLDEGSIEIISKYFKNIKMLSLEGCNNINNNALKLIGKRMNQLIGLHCN
jgi:hypothetical protein